MGKPLVIIHFQPPELYPPVMNLVRFIEKNYADEEVDLITTNTHNHRGAAFKAQKKYIKIRRYGKIYQQQFFLLRLANYLFFYMAATIRLINTRPSKLLYFETLSSFPVYLYKKYINRHCQVFIHYHEYTSPVEYASGMKLARFFHNKERFLYATAQWISHTNTDRLRLFRNDEQLEDGNHFHAMPNYPPSSWLPPTRMPRQQPGPLQIVYVGAVSLDTMYTRQLAEWVIQQDGRVNWDIYTNNITPDAAAYLKQLASSHLHLHEAVDYFALPPVLHQYQAGVILYNGHIPNYVYNAPNKLFEYLACGLDVWVPEEMEGCKPYNTKGAYPAVLPVNFQQLPLFNWQQALQNEEAEYRPSEWYCEQVYPEITGQLFRFTGP